MIAAETITFKNKYLLNKKMTLPTINAKANTEIISTTHYLILLLLKNHFLRIAKNILQPVCQV